MTLARLDRYVGVREERAREEVLMGRDLHPLEAAERQWVERTLRVH